MARKSVHVSCLGHQAGTVAYGGTARWHDGPHGLVLARALAMPCRAGSFLNFTCTFEQTLLAALSRDGNMQTQYTDTTWFYVFSIIIRY